MRRTISIENISFTRNCDIKITNAKSVTEASIWVMFISKNSDTLEIAENSLFNTPIIIPRCGFHSGQLISQTNCIHKIPGLSVNKTRAASPPASSSGAPRMCSASEKPSAPSCRRRRSRTPATRTSGPASHTASWPPTADARRAVWRRPPGSSSSVSTPLMGSRVVTPWASRCWTPTASGTSGCPRNVTWPASRTRRASRCTRRPTSRRREACCCPCSGAPEDPPRWSHSTYT